MARRRLPCMVFSARRLLLAGLLVIAAVIWLRINKPVEGRTLLELTSSHGVTTADLLSLVALAMAVVIAWPSWRAPRESSSAPPAAPWGQAPAPPQGRDRVESPAPGRSPRGGHP